MSQSTSLKEIARSIDLGFLADDVLEALEETNGQPGTDEQKDVFAKAEVFLQTALDGFAIVEERGPIGGGIASAVDSAQGFREAQRAFSALDRPQPDHVRELLTQLLDGVARLARGHRVSGEPLSLLVRFFDALGRSTLTTTTVMLQDTAHQEYERGLRTG